jgi:3-deoxy-manno-octulosonate cytidylyltransferase (CMP-KDO synthetase)
MSFTLLIPARLNSTRLPRKPLIELAGKPMIAHVIERAMAVGAKRVAVATDSAEIAEVVQRYPVACVMTAPELPSGTDRIAVAAASLALADGDIVVNVQGDEPLTPAACIDQVATLLKAAPDAAIATLKIPIDDLATLKNPNAVKVVCDQRGRALYFSRAPIPWPRDAFAQAPNQMPGDGAFFRHVGMYAYRVGFLRAYRLLEPAPLERAEALEQLRALYHGFSIVVATAVEPMPAGVDSDDDVRRVDQILRGEAV